MKDLDVTIIDWAMILVPPVPRDWVVQSRFDFRFEWDKTYVEKRDQKFSPWIFAKNAAAILGYVRANGKSQLMNDMSSALCGECQKHIVEINSQKFVENNFSFSYLWQTITPPFYGSFMNAVTAFGFLQLHEATGIVYYLDLASELLSAIADESGEFQLSTREGDLVWLHEYVYRINNDKHDFQDITRDGWHFARIYNGHAHALLAFLRFKAVTGSSEFDNLISGALEVVRRCFPLQNFENKYFSYCVELPIMPDYGQARAWRLLDGLSRVTGDSIISDLAEQAGVFYKNRVQDREKEIYIEGMNETKKVWFAKRSAADR